MSPANAPTGWRKGAGQDLASTDSCNYYNKLKYFTVFFIFTNNPISNEKKKKEKAQL